MDESQYFRDIGRYPLIPHEEEHELALKAQAGDEAARNRMIEGNLRLVISIAKRYRGRGIPFGDLIAAGNIALFKAVQKFDTSYGCRFSTYASNWIKQGVQRTIETDGPKVHIPSYMQELRRKVDQARTAKHAEGLFPSTIDIVESLGYTRKRARQLTIGLMSARSVSSVKSHTHTADPEEPGVQVDPSEPMVKIESSRRLWEAIADLPERERHILTMRFGIDSGEPMTLSEVAKSLRPQLTRERVRQLIRKSITALRACMEG